MWNLTGDPVHRVDDIVAQRVEGPRIESIAKASDLLLGHYLAILAANVIVAGHYDCLQLGKLKKQKKNLISPHLFIFYSVQIKHLTKNPFRIPGTLHTMSNRAWVAEYLMIIPSQLHFVPEKMNLPEPSRAHQHVQAIALVPSPRIDVETDLSSDAVC